jgi:electron-transferring-flavoprotein dehydrogenase
MNNHGNYIGSLGQVCRWLAMKAERSASRSIRASRCEVLVDDESGWWASPRATWASAATASRRANFTRAWSFAPSTRSSARARESPDQAGDPKRFALDEGRQPQKYGIGIKELWQVAPDRFRPGLVQHSFGWPLDNATGGGSWLYHYGDGLVSVGFVVHLNYENPTLSPFDEFQRFKTHPMIRETFEGGKRLSYGARAIVEGGWQSVPKLAFPGGCLMGDAAGFVNVPRIKGSHNAMLSGILCAEHVFGALADGRAHDEVISYDESWTASEIGTDLYRVRNVKPLWSKFGTIGGVMLGGLDMWTNQLTGRSIFGTLPHGKADHECLKPIDKVKPKVYPRPDGVLSFDKLSSVFLSNTNHEEDQPSHLVLKDPKIPIERNLPLYGEPARLYCPAGVYEVVYGDEAARKDPRFVINAQNCVHCKTCDIKDPSQNIMWVVPEGGGGPNYQTM